MKKTFTIGAVVGASSLLLAVPLFAQFASAASTTSANATAKNRPVPSQVCVQALADMDAHFIATADAMMTAHKKATQAHHDALVATAALTDDTARAAAVDKANADLRTAMKAAMDAQGDKKESMDTLKTACGNAMRGGFGGPMGFAMGHGPKGHGRGMGKDMLRSKFMKNMQSETTVAE